MSEQDEIWLPLVDEPIGSIVQQVEAEYPDIAARIDSPHRLLVFRTFAYVRIGLMLGQLLVEHDVDPYDGSETWVEKLMRHPAYRSAIVDEILAVADEIAADPGFSELGPVGPDDDARERFRAFARRRLA